MSKHTPGPWTCEVSRVNYGDYYIPEAAAEQEHAEDYDNDDGSDAFDDARNDAMDLADEHDIGNGILISAAPDLLEEHHEWARSLGIAFVRALQGDYSVVDRLAHEMPFVFEDGAPVLRSAAIAKANGATE